MKLTLKQTGGEELEKLLKQARNPKKAPRIAAGYLPSTTFSGGGKVAPVAHDLEFGRSKPKQPPRPFFRNALPAIAAAVRRITREQIDPQTLEVTPEIAAEVGQAAATAINRSAAKVPDPALAAGTVARKRRAGFAKPAKVGYASGELQAAAEYEVEKPKGRK